MDLTFQEKVNLSYLFISMYEKLMELYKTYYFPIIDGMNRKKENPTPRDIRIRNYIIQEYGEKQKLKDKERFELLTKTSILSPEEDKLRVDLSKIRDKIAHDSVSIYFDEAIKLDFFRLDEMIVLYQVLIAKMCNFVILKACKTKQQKEEVLKQLYIINVGKIKIMSQQLLIDSKFDKVKELFNKEIVISWSDDEI